MSGPFMKPNPGNTKNTLEQLSFNYCLDVKLLCKPIFEFLNVNSFHFRRHFPEKNESIYLFTDPDWAQHYIDNYALNKDFINKKEKTTEQISKSNLSFLLWKYHFSHLPNYKVAREVFDIDNGIAIIRKHETYTDTYHFATTTKNIAANETYMSNIEPILKFLDYFAIKGQEIICPFLEVISNLPNINSLPSTESLNVSLGGFYKSIELDQLPLMKPGGEVIYLSKREIDCLKGIAIGLTAKDIAQKLCISYRTVQQHLERIRCKTNVTSCTSLLTQLYKDPAVKNFLLRESTTIL